MTTRTNNVVDNLQSEVCSELIEIFELVNTPKKSSPRLRTYDAKTIEEFFDRMEVVIGKLGGEL
jgi:hypothetical protein